MMVILNKKRFLTLMVVFALIAIVDVFIITTRSSRADGGNSGGSYVSGGNDGCGGEVNTCQGASWQYYSHDFSSKPTVSIASYDSSFAPGATITGCGDADGYYRYAWARYGNTSNQVGMAAIGAGDDHLETVFASIFFEYSMYNPYYDSYGDYCYEGQNWNWCMGPDNLYTGWSGGAMWYRGGMNYAQGWNHWSGVYNTFNNVSSSSNFKGNVKTWNKDSLLSWFCYWEDKKVTLSGIAVDESGTGLGSDPNSSQVKSGSSAKIQAKSIAKYDFLGWRTDRYTGTPSGGSEYAVSSLTTDTTVYAVYKLSDYYTTGIETEETSYTEPAGGQDFSIVGASSISSVTNAVNVGGNNYNVKTASAKVSVNFRHDLWQNPQSAFNVNVDYWHDNDAFAAGTLQIPYNSAKSYYPTTQEIPLTLKASDDITQVCQNISFKSKTWSYQYLHDVRVKVSQEYSYHYSGDGEFLGKTKVGEPVTEIVYVSEPYLDNSSLAASGDSGSSENACINLYRRWNFKVGSIVNHSTNDVIYAGDSLNQAFVVEINKNDADYAITDIPNVTVDLCYGKKNMESCTNLYSNATVSGGSGEIVNNTGYSSYDKDNYNISISKEITVSDIEAGAEYCVWLNINPINSGNGYYSSINRGTFSSDKKCYTVAKKPTFQVWGGGVYTSGDIAARTTNKAADGQVHLFGSWAELSLTVGGNNNSLASGAALASSAGGSSLSMASYSPLTIANNGLAGSGIYKDGDRRIDLVEKFRNEYNTYYTNKTYNSSPEVNGVTLVAVVDRDITISGDIKNRDKQISALADVPILIFYAKNIKISCSVARIDAILIAEDTIDTCYDSGEEMRHNVALNSAARSKQLIINGTVIADYLKLGRTYGAGTGENSGIPAEIINTSTGMYLTSGWNSADSNNAYSAYLRELAPRY